MEGYNSCFLQFWAFVFSQMFVHTLRIDLHNMQIEVFNDHTRIEQNMVYNKLISNNCALIKMRKAMFGEHPAVQ